MLLYCEGLQSFYKNYLLVSSQGIPFHANVNIHVIRMMEKVHLQAKSIPIYLNISMIFFGIKPYEQ